ncbi:hypothetical protein [Streptomyces sp. NPDC046862]|uniref:effector-associated constant component EACC1 n=1 Tax=Streptomyces sp. NPDC046862 TaxID=3154603 RepID=UPI00345239BF
MEIRFWAEGSDQDGDQRQDVRSLHEWLRDDRDLRLGGVRIEAVVAAAPGRMGIGPEEIGALCGVVSLGFQVADSVRAWRQARRPTSTVMVAVRGGDPGQAEAIEEALREAGFLPQDRDEPPPSSDDESGGDEPGDSRGNGDSGGDGDRP